jgi:WD40 repeat protein
MEIKQEFAAHKPYALAMQYSGDGRQFISVGMDNVVQIWNAEDWSNTATFKGHEKSSNGLAFSSDEKTLVTCSSDHSVRVWSYPEGEERLKLIDRKVVVGQVRVSAQDSYIVAGYYGGRVVVWNMAGEEQLNFKAHDKHVTGIAISPDETRLATGTQGSEIRLWDLPSGEKVGELVGHEFVSMPMRFSADNNSLYSFGYEGKLIEWEWEQSKQARSFQLQGADIRYPIISEDEQLLGVPMQAQAELYSMDDFTKTDTLPIGSKVTNAIAIAPNNSQVAVSGGDGKIRIFS